jgi:hypothetical protein
LYFNWLSGLLFLLQISIGGFCWLLDVLWHSVTPLSPPGKCNVFDNDTIRCVSPSRHTDSGSDLEKRDQKTVLVSGRW